MPGEWLNILMYDTATYTRANVEKTANSQVRLDAHLDYSLVVFIKLDLLVYIQPELPFKWIQVWMCVQLVSWNTNQPSTLLQPLWTMLYNIV